MPNDRLERVGVAHTDTDRLELYLDRQTKEPVVVSVNTGHAYVLSWADIVSLAVEQGVSVPSSGPEPGSDMVH